MQGFDISSAMLDVAADREVDGDLCLLDLGHGLPLRAGVFDGAISISAIQWLCNAVSCSPGAESDALTLNRNFRLRELCGSQTCLQSSHVVLSAGHEELRPSKTDATIFRYVVRLPGPRREGRSSDVPGRCQSGEAP